jgi:hypothetical protein
MTSTNRSPSDASYDEPLICIFMATATSPAARLASHLSRHSVSNKLGRNRLALAESGTHSRQAGNRICEITLLRVAGRVKRDLWYFPTKL